MRSTINKNDALIHMQRCGLSDEEIEQGFEFLEMLGQMYYLDSIKAYIKDVSEINRVIGDY